MKLSLNFHLMSFSHNINGKEFSYKSKGGRIFVLCGLVLGLLSYFKVISLDWVPILIIALAACIIWDTATVMLYFAKIKKYTKDPCSAEIKDNVIYTDDYIDIPEKKPTESAREVKYRQAKQHLETFMLSTDKFSLLSEDELKKYENVVAAAHYCDFIESHGDISNLDSHMRGIFQQDDEDLFSTTVAALTFLNGPFSEPEWLGIVKNDVYCLAKKPLNKELITKITNSVKNRVLNK